MAPDKKRRVHLRGLVKETGKSVRPVQLAVTELEHAHLLHAEPKGNKKLFSINPSHPLYDSVKQMVADVNELPRADRKLLEQYFTRHTTNSAFAKKIRAELPAQRALPVSPNTIERILQQAHDELGNAQRSVDSPSACLHHCFQAALHAMSAALAARGQTSHRTHPSIIRAFHSHYVAPGRIAKEFIDHVHALTDRTNPPSDPEPHVHKTLEFVLTIREVINTP